MRAKVSAGASLALIQFELRKVKWVSGNPGAEV